MSDNKTEDRVQVQTREKEVRKEGAIRPLKRGIRTGIKAGTADYVCW